ncbi:unannotated protein [freshwater metagenome]|uniref:Unannotated protein n=1 Tax=freshwater metagenome TaxID=449393 RepID=A0A6J6DQ67_9ZZZZ
MRGPKAGRVRTVCTGLCGNLIARPDCNPEAECDRARTRNDLAQNPNSARQNRSTNGGPAGCRELQFGKIERKENRGSHTVDKPIDFALERNPLQFSEIVTAQVDVARRHEPVELSN